jgi:hypothetical protein
MNEMVVRVMLESTAIPICQASLSAANARDDPDSFAASLRNASCGSRNIRVQFGIFRERRGTSVNQTNCRVLFPVT